MCDQTQAPVEILPWLYLGNSMHSEDLEALQKYNIRVSITLFHYTKSVSFIKIKEAKKHMICLRYTIYKLFLCVCAS